MSWLDKLFKVDRPYAATLEEWDSWRESLANRRPLTFLVVEVLPKWQNKLYYMTIGRLASLHDFLYNSLITKTHALTATSLQVGAWHELDTRILHALMDELTRFVEVELAWMNQRAEGQKRKRSRADGLQYLDWASKLSAEDSDGEPAGFKSALAAQAEQAQEIRAIYIWWNDVRSKRAAPEVECGLTAFEEEMNRKYKIKKWRFAYGNKMALTAEEDALYNKLVRNLFSIEEARDIEDDAMLIRLLKIRRGLWT